KILLALLALQLALDGAATGRVGLTLGGFGVAGLAAASKYTGLFAVAGPAWLALKADTPEGRWAARRVGLLGAGGGTAAIAFPFACVPCWCQFEGFLRGIRLVGTSAYLVGAPGVDLALGWPQHRYVYPLVVALPYMMGWPVYLAALLGFALVWRSRRATAALLLATTVPYFLFIGGGVSAVPRYYLLLCPFLALAAGATLDWLWQTTGTRRTLGRGIAGRRARPDGFGITLFRELQRGGLGFRAAGDFRTSFLTEALYTWGDPTLDTHWETAIAGYKVFVREPG